MSDIFPTLNGSERIGRTLYFDSETAVDAYDRENGPALSLDGDLPGVTAAALATMQFERCQVCQRVRRAFFGSANRFETKQHPSNWRGDIWRRRSTSWIFRSKKFGLNDVSRHTGELHLPFRR